MKKLLTNNIVHNIHKKLDSIEKKEINHVIKLFMKEIIKKVINNQSVSITNFGTFSTYLFHSHKGYDVNNKIITMTKSHLRVRFHPHIVLTKELNSRKKYFAGKKKS